MKVFLFAMLFLVAWALFLLGCRASLRAGSLESDIAFSGFGNTAPPPVEFIGDKDSKPSE